MNKVVNYVKNLHYEEVLNNILDGIGLIICYLLTGFMIILMAICTKTPYHRNN